MGYSGAELRLNAKIAGAAFVPVSGAKTMDLSEIKVTGYDAWEGWDEEDEPIGGSFGEVYVQILNATGKDTASYYWLDFDEEGSRYLGWYKDSDTEQPLVKGDVVLAPGEGILSKCETFDFDYQLQSAGQVLTDKDMPTLLRLNARMVSNVTPVEVDLKDCYVTGYDPWQGWDEEDEPIGGAFGEVYVQVLDPTGKDIASYYWIDFSEDEDKYFGWYKDSDTEQPIAKGAVTMGAGQGILAKCETFDFDYCFVWPKVDVK